jgi:putative DNA primase/helicase
MPAQYTDSEQERQAHHWPLLEGRMAATEDGDGCSICVELEALMQKCRSLGAAATPDPRVEDARAVRIEDEFARRGIQLRGRGPEREGSCRVCGGTDRFSINTKKQVWNCRGCQQGGDIIKLVMHLDELDFPEAVEKLAGRPAPKNKVAARFDYHDEAGALLYQVERIDLGTFKDGKREKKFTQRRSDGNGGWINGPGCMDGVRHVPYRLPELIEAVGNENIVLVVEGERKVDLLRSWNIAATCNSGGSKKWRAEHSAFLRGANVVILPDNDPPGRKHLDAVAASVKEVGAAVRVLTLPGLPPKGDVVDWAASGGTAEQLHDLIEHDARPWVPGDGPDPAGEPKGNARKTNSEGPHDGAEQWTELGNAHRLIHRHGANIRYVHPFKAWFIWDGTFWRRDDDGESMRRAEGTIESLFDEASLITDDATRQAFRKFALKSQSHAQIRAMVQLAQHSSYVVVSPDALDADPMLLGVPNGTVDLATREFREGEREDYITMQAGVAFDRSAQCPNWIAFQEKIADGNVALIAYKQRLFGLLLTGQMVEILFILHGCGQNGKSTEIETINGILGDYAHSADAQVLLSQKDRGGATPEIVAIKGKRAVFINETAESDRLNEARVKYLCGNDTMSGRNLFEGIINFQPTHKTLLRTNHKPEIRGTDLGIWRRIHYVPYLVTITDGEKVERFRQERLEPERAGILNWMLDGLKDYLVGGLRPPPIVVAATKEYRNEMDTVGQWIAVMCEPSLIGAKLFLKTLFESYKKWADDEVGWTVSKKKFAEILRERVKDDVDAGSWGEMQ